MMWLVRVGCLLKKNFRSSWTFRASTHIRTRSWSSKEVRSKFIQFFEDQGHRHVPSSSVIPKKGDGTYFTNAGMNQFKPLFLGQCDPSSKLWGLTRAVNSQKCIRVGGKHNDLEDVGHDLTHHTFFEMLGSWSFGDYFKKEACSMAYDLLTNHFSLPTDRLYFTYFGGDSTLGLSADEECLDIWASLGVPRDRILPFGVKDNFWDMGVTGPCGPCTEIHYDHVGGRNAAKAVNSGSPEVVEIWNLVFMQYNRQADQSLLKLPNCHVDTGMGLERMVAVMQGTADNYATDLFLPLFDLVHKTVGGKPYSGRLTERDTAYRMLADHARMFSVAISDGLLPSNDNLGHKVRTVLHKCIQICRSHFNTDPHILLPALAKGVVTSLAETYPELQQSQDKVIEVVASAIDHHTKSWELAQRSFQKMMNKVKPTNVLSGEVMVFLERGQFGQPVPMEMLEALARRHGLEMDLSGYQQCLTIGHSDNKSRYAPLPAAQSRSPVDDLVDLLMAQGKPATQDVFKYHINTSNGGYGPDPWHCSIEGMLGKEREVTHRLEQGQTGEITLNQTCFYAEAGGQEADTGELRSETGVFLVEDVQSHRGHVVHSGHVLEGCLTSGQNVVPSVCSDRRQGNMRNHTATHLLSSALLDVLPSTQQEGSSISSQRFTFDFLALSKLEMDHLDVIESKVREVIHQGHSVTCQEMSLEEALAIPSVRPMQNEEYPDRVRLVSVGSVNPDSQAVSMELCGGTHVSNTSEIADFCITGLNAKSQHVKRVTCVTGQEATQAVANGQIVDGMCSLLQELYMCVSASKTPSNACRDLVQTLTQKAQQINASMAKRLLTAYDSDGMKEEVNKTQSVLVFLCDNLQPLLTGSSVSLPSVMKALVHSLRQCQQLELLPKTVRESSQKRLQEMEHRIQALANAEKIADLKQVLSDADSKGSHSQPSFVSVDSDLDPRQVLKAISQQPLLHPVCVYQKTRPSWNLYVACPSLQHTTDSKDKLDSLLAKLKHLGSSKGKIATHKNGLPVWRVTVKGGNLDKELVEKEILNWWIEMR